MSLINEANKIVEGASKESRKEQAQGIFEMGYAITGLMCSSSKDQSTRDSTLETMKAVFADNGFRVGGKEKQLEATVLLLILETSIKSKYMGLPELDAMVKECFDERIWNKCVFDTQEVGA